LFGVWCLVFVTRISSPSPKSEGSLKHEHKGAKTRSFLKTKMLKVGEYSQPFEPIERIEPFEHLKHLKLLKPQKPLKPLQPFQYLSIT
jgi:hypothetical protein